MIAGFYSWLAGTINRKPYLVAGLIVLVFVLGLYGTTQLTMQTGWET